MNAIRSFLFASLTSGCLGSADDIDIALHEEAVGAGVVVNECSAGTGGFIELYNPGAAAVDLAGDASSCWYVDDTAGGGVSKRITDAVVSHAAGSTTCADVARPATCGLVGPGERVWVSYSYVNRTSPDQCRLLTAPLAGGVCGAQSDVGVGGATSATALGQCFGRRPDGGSWEAAEIACTPGGGSNGCAVGGACTDGDACTTGETLDAGCVCGAGAPVDCDDANACTSDSCDSATGCGHGNVADGTACGASSECSGGICVPVGGGASIVDGAENRIRLLGTVVGPDGAFEGEVLVEGTQITCVAASCADAPGAAGATVIDTQGILFPGMIDAHNHGLFDVFDESDWTPSKLYGNHNQWTNEARYHDLVDAKQWLTGEEAASPVDYKCEMDKWGEMKALVAGTTSMVVAPGTSRACFASLIRSIDVSQNDLGFDRIQTSISVPTNSGAQSVCNNFASGSTDAYVVHVAEGVDATAKNEFTTLSGRAGGCLLAPQTTIVHGTALGEAEFETMANAEMSLVWSPRSNDFLYGGTTRIDLAVAAGVQKIALAPDWSIGGSANLLDELRFAQGVDETDLGGLLGSQRLVDMVTIDAARTLGLDGILGSIEVGKRADLVVVAGDAAAPYDALIAATPATVRLVIVDGRVLYGDSALSAAGPADPGCESETFSGAEKFLCIAEASAVNLFDQTYEEIRATLDLAFSNYDADFMTPETAFSPIAALVP